MLMLAVKGNCSKLNHSEQKWTQREKRSSPIREEEVQWEIISPIFGNISETDCLFHYFDCDLNSLIFVYVLF